MKLRSFASCHESVAWVYQTGWQNVYFGYPLPPLVMTSGNAIRNMEYSEGAVIVYEDARGDLGGGMLFPTVRLDIETGKPKSTRCTFKRPETVGQELTQPTEGTAIRISDAWEFSWQSEDDLEVFLTHLRRPVLPIRVIQREGYGEVYGWRYVEEHGVFLIAVSTRRPFSPWTSNSYIVCIDLKRHGNNSAVPTALPVAGAFCTPR